jgi:hypothetical protein
MRRLVLLLVAVALVAPATARAVEIEGFYGLERPPEPSFSAATSGASAPDVFNSSLQIAGGDVLFSLGGLEFGAIADVTFGHDTASQSALGALAGIALSPGGLKIDLLAEAGGHRYGNFTSTPEIVTSSSKNEWLFYVGLRPGLAFKLGDGPLFVGLWAFVRWDMTSQHVPVTVGNAGSSGSLKLGGTTVGATVRLGFGF